MRTRGDVVVRSYAMEVQRDPALMLVRWRGRLPLMALGLGGYLCLAFSACAHRLAIPDIQALLDRGARHYESGEYAQALKDFSSTLSAIDLQTADIHYRIGRAQSRLFQNDEALASFQRALVFARSAHNRSFEAVLLHAVAEVYQSLEEMEEARQHYEEALTIRREVQDQLGEARTLAGLASTYLDLGRYDRALALYESAVALLIDRGLGSPQDIGAIFTSIGSLYAYLGQYSQALAFHQKAAAVYGKANDRRGVAIAFHNAGFTHFENRDYTAAVLAFERALANRPTEDRLGRAKTLNNLGLTWVESGQAGRGLDALIQALAIFQDLGNEKYAAATLDSIGSAYQALGDHAKALESFSGSLFLWRRLAYKEGERVTLANLGALYRERGQTLLEIFYLKLAVNTSQELRAGTVGLDRELQRTFTRRVEASYRDLAQVLIEAGRLAEAEQVLAMLKEYEHFEFLRRDITTDSRQMQASLTKEERDLAALLNKTAQSLSTLFAQIEPLRKLTQRSDEQEANYQSLRGELNLASQRFATVFTEVEQSLARPSLGSASVVAQEAIESRATVRDALAWLQEQSGVRAGALYILPAETDTVFILTTQNGSLSIKGGLGKEALNQLIGQLRQSMTERKSDYLEIAGKLYEALIKPARPLLEEAKIEALMLYLIDALRYVPVAALYDTTDKKYLVEQYTLSIYTAAAREKLKEFPKFEWLAVAFGMSKAKPPYGALPSVPLELSRVVREERSDEIGILRGNRYLDEKFTRKQLLTLLDEQISHSVMHVATHFKFVPGSQEQSVLLLGDGDLMTLQELNTDQGIRLGNYDLVTLSACDTAVSSNAKGEEIEGLAVILQKRGAKSVLATLWQVQDEGTAKLMEQFYRERGEQRKATKAEALQRAQIALLRGAIKSSDPKIDLRHPYYWAPFVLMGNWM